MEFGVIKIEEKEFEKLGDVSRCPD